MHRQVLGFRLSPQQKRLWLLQQSAHNQPYRALGAVLIEGNLDREVLKAAVSKVVSRHEILRTTFHCLPEMTIPLQVIADGNVVWSHDCNLSNLGQQEQEAEVERLFERGLRGAFDFHKGPLLSVSLVTLSHCKSLLLLCLSALCADKVTLHCLVCEIVRCYAASLRNEELPDEPMQFANLAEWQNELLESEETETGRSFWRNQNLFPLLTVKLPFENPVSGTPGFKPQTFTLTMRPNLVEKIGALTGTHDTSLFLLACWQVLIWRLTGESDIVVGTPCEGRKYEELEVASGPLTKYVPVHCRLQEDLRFSEVLGEVARSTREAYKWQEYFSLEQIVKSSGNGAGLLFIPLCFDFDKQAESYVAGDISFSIHKQYVCVDQFKVKLACVQKPDCVVTEFHYDSNLFGVEDIQRLAGEFHTLLESAVKNPEACIDTLEILTPTEREELLTAFNNTKVDYAPIKCIQQFFEEQVKRTPDGIAVVFEDDQLTYAALNARANKLAHHLQRLGVGPEVLVALFMERSVEMIIGLLGILKAGGAYVPLDTAQPKDRLALMLEDSQAPVLLTQQGMVGRLPAFSGRVVCLDSDWDAISQEIDENVMSGAGSENLIYVIFTSGSTGRPKGVAVEHRQVANYVSSIVQVLDLPARGRFATVSPLAADLGNTMIFPSLCTGGSLHLVSQERASDPDAFADYLACHRIDCLKIVPSHLSSLLATSRADEILPRQRLILGGEASHWDETEKLQGLAPDCLIFNHYGPTETTIGVMTCRVEHGRAHSYSMTVPIGRPIDNAQIYLLDSHLRPVPIGVPGELFVGGAGLARGYLNRPHLTAEKFVPSPLGDESGLRLYKTGDLARHLPDGNIEFLGRIDDQVKIHGFRIELGEVEAVLRGHPAVRDAVVIAREDRTGNKRMVAYASTKHGLSYKASDLRSFLSQKLPEHMIPSSFVILDSLPRTSNGKLDRRALPEPDDARRKSENAFVAPRNRAEETLARIWALVLGLDRVGVHDDFFELGGDSMLSIQVVAKAKKAGLQLSPKDIFQYKTIDQLAVVAGAALPRQFEQGAVTGIVPFTPIQRWFFDQEFPDPHCYNVSVLVELRQAIDPLLLEKVLRQLLYHHDALRLRFKREESSWRQINAGLGDLAPLSTVDLSELSELEQKVTIQAVTTALHASLNLSKGPILRAALFQLGAEKPNVLLMVIHHLAVDVVSCGILLEDIQTAYMQLESGQKIELAPKTTSFKQWAERLEQYAQTSELEKELCYWLSEPLSKVQRLPADYPGSVNSWASVRSVPVVLSAEETRTLLQEVPKAYNTQIDDVLLTALAQAFVQWTGKSSVLFELERHGREEIFENMDLSRTVGWFTMTFPIVLTLGESSTPEDALKSVREQLRGIPNHGIGYGLLRYLTGNEEIAEKLRALPQPEIGFNYLSQFDRLVPNSSLFELAREVRGPNHYRQGIRRYLIDIIGAVSAGQLRLIFRYSENFHRRPTVEALSQNYLEALRTLINHCRYAQVSGQIPSRLAKSTSSQVDLSRI